MKKKAATHISKDDLTEFTVTQLRTELATEKSASAALRKHIAQMSQELDIYRLRELHESKKSNARAHAELADAEKDQAYAAHRKFAASLADRYNYDTKTTAIDPITGAIVPLPNA